MTKPKTKTKPVTSTFFKKQSTEVNKKEKYFFNEENEEFIYYYPKFSKSKRDNLIKELLLTVEKCKQENIQFLQNDYEILQYLHFLIIKHFTSIESELKDKPLETHLALLNQMYEADMFNLFFEDIFDIFEVQKVIDELYLLGELNGGYDAKVDEFKSKIESTVQSELLKEKALKKLN